MDDLMRNASAPMRRREALAAFDILDTPSEADFDDLVKLAAEACGAPVALISFVDAARQWFKARTGFGPSETPLASSICAHAIKQHTLFIIEDTTQDDRTSENPLVTGPPHVRFYAGMPLVTPDGVAIGTLCVLDTKPRALTASQHFILQTLAHQVMAQLLLRRLLREQQRSVTAHAALIELGDRLRDVDQKEAIIAVATDIMARVFGVERVGFGSVDPEAETVMIGRDWCAPGFASLARLHHFREYGSYIEDLRGGDIVAIENIAEDPRTAADAAIWNSLQIKANLNVPIMERGRFVALVFLAAAAPRAWLAEELVLARNIADRMRAAIARVEAEEQQRVLNLELSHRMKNMLTMVQAIANQTLRRAPDMETAKTVLSARLVALGRAQDILLGRDGRGMGPVALGDVVEGALRPYRQDNDQIAIEGPYVAVSPKSALSISLIVHELATNAIKYGALSQPAGRVSVAWQIQSSGAEPTMCLQWSEQGGPPVTPPARRGFGSRLIEGGLASSARGTVTLAYEPTGVTCAIISAVRDLRLEDGELVQL